MLNYLEGSSLFTFITSSVLESKDLNDSYINILLKCRVRHLPVNHFEAINEDGEKKPSLGELLLLTIAKNVTHRDNLIESDIHILLEELEYVEKNYSNIPYVNYYKAKAYNCLGDKLKAEEAILIYLKESKEYLAWELLSDISDDKERKVQALCKSVICHTRPGQLLRSKTKLFYLLVKEKKFDVAKSLIKISLKQSKSSVRIDLMIGVPYLMTSGLNQLKRSRLFKLLL